MRFELTIPDQVYRRAQKRSVETGVSMDRLFSDAVAHHLIDEDSGPEVTPELLASLRAAEADIAAGRGLTPEEVRLNLEQRKLSWLQTHTL